MQSPCRKARWQKSKEMVSGQAVMGDREEGMEPSRVGNRSEAWRDPAEQDRGGGRNK